MPEVSLNITKGFQIVKIICNECYEHVQIKSDLNNGHFTNKKIFLKQQFQVSKVQLKLVFFFFYHYQIIYQ